MERRMPQRIKRKRALLDDEEGFEVQQPGITAFVWFSRKQHGAALGHQTR